MVAQPGRDFVVKVGMEPPDGGRECPARLARAALYVDGRDVGYWVRLVAARSPTERFSGFPDGRGGRRTFRFAPPTVREGDGDAAAAAAATRDLGSVRVEFFACLMHIAVNKYVKTKKMPRTFPEPSLNLHRTFLEPSPNLP